MSEVPWKYTDPAERRMPADEWIPFSAEVGQVVLRWANRGDLITYVGADGGRGQAAALFEPRTAQVEVNNTIAFGEHVSPADIGNFQDRRVQEDWPKASGAIFHEAMHAAHTRMSLSDAAEALKPEEHRYFMWLEESRIEGKGVMSHPQNQPFLRSCALEIVLKDALRDPEPGEEKLTLVRQAAKLALLSLARVDAGVLEATDILRLRPILDTVLGEATIKAMRKIWREFLLLDYRDVERMYELARAMHKLIEERADEAGDPKPGQMGDQGGDGFPADMPEWMKDMIKQMMKALGGDAAQTGFSVNDDIEDARAEERANASRREKEKLAKEKSEADEKAQETFERSVGPNGTRSRSQLSNTRDPSNQERIAANRIGRAMQQARYRDRLVTEKMTALPPGKLRPGVAMQGAAYSSRGMNKRIEPFRARVHHHVEDPNLTVGIMCDISGSMGGTMEPMSIATWVMQEAVRKIQGRAAAIYYGNDIFPVLKPGQHQKQVTEYTAADGSEDFNGAFKALDGALTLLHGRGARLLVNVSDGRYRPEQAAHCERWMARCKAMGVAVVWIGLSGGYAQEICNRHGAQYVEVGSDVMAATNAIGKACTTALNRASR